jgi:hypothetical protein
VEGRQRGSSFALAVALFYRPLVATRWTRWAALAVGLATGTSVLSAAEEAIAQPTGENNVAPSEEELGPEAGVKRPAGLDERTGHVLVQAKVGYSQPLGRIAAGLPASNVVSGGAAFGASVGLGLNRGAVLEVSASYARLSAASQCPACAGSSFDLGLGLVYHIAQGIAFDPWISYGAGYRRATFSGSTGLSAVEGFPEDAFHGLDLARVALGGDFYPAPAFGIGAFVELGAGTYLSRPDDFGAAAYGFLQVGLRLAFDPLPRGTRASARATHDELPANPRALAGRDAVWRW